jgi:hypothetical protein
MGELLQPIEYRQVSGPLIFLAGPIQGAADWQSSAITFLQTYSHLNIASPRRATNWNERLSIEAYNEQVDWEHHHLERSAAEGVILFWLAREAEHVCDRAYAQTTRFELGEAVTLHRWHGTKVVVGIDLGFTNARYLKKTIAHKAPGIPLCFDLKDTCEAAVRLLKQPTGTVRP